MFLFVVSIGLIFLLFRLLSKIKCKPSSTDLFFANYQSKNSVLNIEQILVSYNELLYSFYKEKSINVIEFYRFFELLTIHVLINWVIESIYEKDQKKKIKHHVRILNLINKYTSIFIIDDFFTDEIKISFLYQLIDNLQHLNHENIFLIYKYMENIYIDNIHFHEYIKNKLQFSPSISTLQIDRIKLSFYIDFIKTKNINFLQYI